MGVMVRHYGFFWLRIILPELLAIILFFVLINSDLVSSGLVPIMIAIELLLFFLLILSFFVPLLRLLYWAQYPLRISGRKIIHYSKDSGDPDSLLTYSLITKNTYTLKKISSINIDRGYIILSGNFIRQDETLRNKKYYHRYNSKKLRRIRLPRIYKDDKKLIQIFQKLV